MQQTVHALDEMYGLMREEDLWAGLWQTHAIYQDTKTVSTARSDCTEELRLLDQDDEDFRSDCTDELRLLEQGFLKDVPLLGVTVIQ